MLSNSPIEQYNSGTPNKYFSSEPGQKSPAFPGRGFLAIEVWLIVPLLSFGQEFSLECGFVIEAVRRFEHRLIWPLVKLEV